MFTASHIIAASQLFAVAFGAPLFSANPQQARSLVERTAYKVFGGDGTTAQGWPQESEWTSFEDAWKANVATTLQSCSQFSQENNSQEESDNIKKAIQELSSETGVKAEFILSIVMQESKGCVRAPTTNYGYDNPGLMQSFMGTSTCNPDGNGVSPCPYDTIKGMITDGVGVGKDNGLVPALKKAGTSDVSQYYKAARIYNSGSIDASGNLNAGIATHCYATDVANRLIGWTDSDTHGCEEATIVNVGAGSSNGASTSTDTASNTTDTASNPDEGTEESTPTADNTAASSTAAKFSGASSTCTSWYTVKTGDSCSSTGVDMTTLVSLNVGLSADCSNLWANTQYCIAG